MAGRKGGHGAQVEWMGGRGGSRIGGGKMSRLSSKDVAEEQKVRWPVLINPHTQVLGDRSNPCTPFISPPAPTAAAACRRFQAETLSSDWKTGSPYGSDQSGACWPGLSLPPQPSCFLTSQRRPQKCRRKRRAWRAPAIHPA